jgi:hypothetical protein
MDAACGTCRFAEPTVDAEDGPYLQCRRYPPTVVGTDDNARAGVVVPLVDATDWCGEYQEAT